MEWHGVVITHHDYDHIGVLAQVLDRGGVVEGDLRQALSSMTRAIDSSV
ncbi:MAG: hypothetical protein HFE97_00355 [Oscillospiraceae bacterium]|nr:hypothetical protein [Oscillospiraceae bacterium]